ncbi:ADP-ribosylation factor-like protein 4C [Eriocheir sinensis]|uniref:ADP-ribosylation factor-like protein 4C n=1 Tax=Eriocheir sinensis TaxID=95602 RepID=UPI0021C76A5A|nr:ADP-ribosylation factor-like protein 4C [Eriocheir sinensis]
MGGSMGKGGSGKGMSLLDALPSLNAPLHVVMLGLDSAGKTTALYRLKFDQYLNTVPTIGFNCEKIKGTSGRCKGTSFLVWDVGGQEKLRPLWRSYTRCTDGIVFVVDSTDTERMDEAKMELVRTVRAPENHHVPILVLANKQDLPGARDAKQVEKSLGLWELGPSQLFHVQPSCAIIGDGLADGLECLYEMICKKKKITRSSHKSSKKR